jgi:hypothetical protein
MGLKRTHCKRGHERTPENLTSSRKCKICSRLTTAIWKEENWEQVVADEKERRRKYPEKYKAISKKAGEKIRIKMTDGYIRSILTLLGFEQIPIEVIDLKRQHLMLKREIKNAKYETSMRNTVN